MTTKLTRERAATRVGATTSGVDVETPDGQTQVSCPARRRRQFNALFNLARAGLVVGAVVIAGGAAVAGSGSTATTAATPNSVSAFGRAPALGSGEGHELHAGIVGMAGDPVAPGYWLVAADGGVFAFGKSKFFGSTGAATLNSPVVGITATPAGRGYWLVAADGGVFAFGDAAYYGSLAKTRLAAPITSIVSTSDGDGYWLVGSDGGVFAFGDAKYHGSAKRMHLARPIVGAAKTRSGRGYWLVGADGGVFSFGDARFSGAEPDLAHPVVGIAAAPNGHGYWIARADGRVDAFGLKSHGNDATFSAKTGQAHTVAVAASSVGGYWIAQGAADADSTLSSNPFLACTRAHESNGAGGYSAVSAGGTYRGAYQFDRSTWNSAARLAGRSDLVGVDPATATPADQDLLALDLFHARGAQPWGGRCGHLS